MILALGRPEGVGLLTGRQNYRRRKPNGMQAIILMMNSSSSRSSSSRSSSRRQHTKLHTELHSSIGTWKLSNTVRLPAVVNNPNE